MFCWSRNFYAKNGKTYFCFEAKKDRDFMVNNFGFAYVIAKEAYNYDCKRVYTRKFKETVRRIKN